MKRSDTSAVSSAAIDEIIRLESRYTSAKTSHYRYVIRSEDKEMLSKMIKIPDNWDNYQPREGVRLTESIKQRLSDIKRKMSWELKLQSLYFIYITSIENVILSVLQQRDIEKQELNDATDSINNISIELDDELLNIKHLLLTLAKRSISDFYYLVSAYCKFFYKKNFHYESDIRIVLNEFVKIVDQQVQSRKRIEEFKKYELEISSLFQTSSNELGWRLNEFIVKEYFEKENKVVKIMEFNRLLKDLCEYKNNLRNYFNFLKYYYNETDGKMFRMNFIYDSLRQKLEDNKISNDTFKTYENIRISFINYRNAFEAAGITVFGNHSMPYIDIVHLIYKICKIMEFYYLRNMKYDNLQNLRNEYLLHIEKEISALTV
ncbi:MAG TPA: hypothetical protein PK514_00140 [Spirochaetota bacterium]|nr:hypothetical protein [Spirochaetota bacterium]